MKKCIKRLFCIALSLTMIVSLLPGFSISSAASLNNESSYEKTASDVSLNELDKLVSSCSYYRSTCWESESWSELYNAFTYAYSVLSDENAKQSEIDKAFNDLTFAKQSLVHEGQITECDYCLGNSKSIGEDNVTYLRKVFYSNRSNRNFMAMYIPKNKIGDCPLILYVHGGAWVSGSNATYLEDAKNDCIKYGAVTIAIRYRYISEEVNCFDILDDITDSVTKAKDRAAQYGLNLNKLMVTGTSAGPHLALLYAYSRADISAVKPVCVFEKTGPTNLSNPAHWNSHLGASNMARYLTQLSGQTVTDEQTQLEAYDALQAISPIHYVNSNTVPTIICHGYRDTTIDYSEAETLDKVLTDNGVEHELIRFNSLHDLSKDKKMTAYSLTRFEDYVNKYLFNDCPDGEHNYVSESFAAESCSKDGYTMNVCEDCGKYYVSDVVKIPHTLETDKGYPATCTQNGLTDGAHCTVCNKVVTPQEVILASGHREETVVTLPATYTETGLKVTRCSVCGEVFSTEVIPVLKPEFSAKNDSVLLIDTDTKLVRKIPQGTYDLGKYLDLGGCTVEYSDSVVATGSTITIKSLSGETLADFVAVVDGDVDGDAFVDAFDVAVISSVANFETEFEEDSAYLYAADLIEDGFVDSFDCSVLISMANFE